jgi:hypothetical protein
VSRRTAILEAACSVDGVPADCLIRKQRRRSRVAVNPGVQFLGPLFGIHCSSRCEPSFQPLPDGLKPNIYNVAWLTYHAGLDRLPDDPFLFRIQMNSHTTFRLSFLRSPYDSASPHPSQRTTQPAAGKGRQLLYVSSASTHNSYTDRGRLLACALSGLSRIWASLSTRLTESSECRAREAQFRLPALDAPVPPRLLTMYMS